MKHHPIEDKKKEEKKGKKEKVIALVPASTWEKPEALCDDVDGDAVKPDGNFELIINSGIVLQALEFAWLVITTLHKLFPNWQVMAEKEVTSFTNVWNSDVEATFLGRVALRLWLYQTSLPERQDKKKPFKMTFFPQAREDTKQLLGVSLNQRALLELLAFAQVKTSLVVNHLEARLKVQH